MMPLADRQAAFLRAILDEGAPLPAGWGNSQSAGMAVYRGNYRSALMGALAETYERTARHVGEQPFAQACINHAIAHPPSGWTIDEAGAGFDATCAALFPDNPEAAELAWLEWTMMSLATAPDCAPLTPEAFSAAVSGFGDAEWSDLRLALQPRAAARLVEHDLEALWRALGEERDDRPAFRLAKPQACLVWREGERPTFILAEAGHADAFALMQRGACYGELIELLIGDDPEPSAELVQSAAMRAGTMLGLWLKEGIIVSLNPSRQP
ncbi:putative DNA-binding domain-containing protein [Qipengyuania sp. ASV99]|uniref:HvfC/BufC family peptide modification chaperone n=1 Tax=Qipengyuania sp. ASV99 TaxID=3399681 RepID=UPI003A4C7D6C